MRTTGYLYVKKTSENSRLLKSVNNLIHQSSRCLINFSNASLFFSFLTSAKCYWKAFVNLNERHVIFTLTKHGRSEIKQCRVLYMMMMIGSGVFTEDRCKVFDVCYKRSSLDTIVNKFNKSIQKHRIFSPIPTSHPMFHPAHTLPPYVLSSPHRSTVYSVQSTNNTRCPIQSTHHHQPRFSPVHT